MPRAVRNGHAIAESDHAVVVEGNHHFPRDAVRDDLAVDGETRSTCPWKGTARYHSIQVEDALNRDAAWYYPEPKPAAEEIRGRVAFWLGVEVHD